MKKILNRYQLFLLILLPITAMLLVISIILFIKGNYLAVLRQTVSNETYHYEDNASYVQRKTQFEMLPSRETDIVFLGDSITARFEWQEYYSDLAVSNRGIDSDVCEGALNRLDTVINQNPDKVFIMLGINDIRQQIPQDVTIGYYEQIIKTLKQALPDCEIYIQSVLPVHHSTGIDNSRVQELNKKIKELADANSLTYIDLYSKLVVGDNDFTYTRDGVHPTGEGYQIWLEQINGYVYE